MDGHIVTPEWERTLSAIAESPGVVLVLGAPDAGKTTYIATAMQWLSHRDRLPLALVNTDIGQAAYGLPAAVSLGILQERPVQGALDVLRCEALSFVGSTSPMGHALPLVVSAARLVRLARRSGAKIVLVDTSGLIAPGFGFQLKLRKIELLEPHHIVALQHDMELEPLLSVLRSRDGLYLHRLRISPFARARTRAERAAYRIQRFTAYFTGSKLVALPTEGLMILAPPLRRSLLMEVFADIVDAGALRAPDLAGLLVGVNNGNDETLGLGLLEGVGDDGLIYLRTPVADVSHVQILQLGSMRLDRTVIAPHV